MVVAAERETRALQLRAAGVSFEQIGRALNITPAAAWKACKRALDRVPVEDAEQLRATEAAMLNDIRRQAWEVASRRHWLFSGGKQVMMETPDGPVPVEDEAPRLAALALLIRNSESMRRLFALDAPIVVNAVITDREGVAERVMERVAHLKLLAAGGQEDAETPVFIDEKAAAKGRQLRGDFYDGA